MDANNRVYYVDHNTRTTTWHPPSEHLIHNVVRWRQWYDSRAGNMRNQMADLYASSAWTLGAGAAAAAPTSSLAASAAQANSVPESLGPLPEGFGEFEEADTSFHIPFIAKQP